MASPVPESIGFKRKRSPIEEAATRPPPPAVHMGGVTQINYMMQARNEKLRLIEGDIETFSDVLGMIDDYEGQFRLNVLIRMTFESHLVILYFHTHYFRTALTSIGVLQRHESFAANLGAKLVGPLLLKSLEKLFDGPIKVIQPSFALEQTPVTWLDIVTFARTNLSEFVMSDSAQGKVYRLWIKGGQIEISEDDYRLIMSGAPERMIPTQPVPEDETSELATLNILEVRLTMLIKKADAVASKARQLNYHLKGRKTAILARKAEHPGTISESPSQLNFSPQPSSSLNNRSPHPVTGDSSSKLQRDLLEQFLSTERRNSGVYPSHPKRRSAEPLAEERCMSQPMTSSDDGIESQLRILMAAKIDRLAKGNVITPPCDRCRRLRFECTKNLTACSACTKKHAKCSWKDVRDGELEGLSHISGANGYGNGNGNGKGSASGNGNGFSTSNTKAERSERNLDPGLRTDAPRGNGSTLSDQDVDQIDRTGLPGPLDVYTERRAEGSLSEQAILTHIANAATASGPL